MKVAAPDVFTDIDDASLMEIDLNGNGPSFLRNVPRAGAADSKKKRGLDPALCRSDFFIRGPNQLQYKCFALVGLPSELRYVSIGIEVIQCPVFLGTAHV